MERISSKESFLDSSNLFQTSFFTWSFSLCKYFKSHRPSFSNIFPPPKSLKYSQDLQKIRQIILNTETSKKIDLIPIFWKVMKVEYVISVISGLISNIFLICSSILVYFILSGLKSGVYSTSFLIVLAISNGIIIQASFSLRNFSIFKTFLIVSKIRGILIELCYEKILKLGVTDLNSEGGVGKIMNLINLDVENFGGLQNLPGLFSIPFVLIISTIFLYTMLGVSSLVGVLAILIHLPISYLIGKLIANFRSKTFCISDKRLNLISDLVDGIKTIKLYGWESHFLEKIIQARSKELSLLTKESTFSILSKTINLNSNGIVILFTFMTYILSGNELDPASAFSAITAFTICNSIVTGKSVQGILSCIIIKLSFSRFSDFISSPEKPKSFINSNSKYSLKLKSCAFVFKPNNNSDHLTSNVEDFNHDKSKINNFEYNTEASSIPNSNFHLNHINFKVSEGELVVITGRTGSGKSSLLLAMLEELQYVSGEISSKGSIAYTSQHPWLVEGSVRQNILMGNEMNKSLYEKVIKVCALDKDLCTGDMELLDELNVGCKGRNVSGGQMARISLARALYSNKDIYLLDDPFSAIDLPLQAKLFKSCIEFMLRGKTIIIATSNVSLLESADKILLLDKGSQLYFGSYSEFVESQFYLLKTLTFNKRRDIRELTERPLLKLHSSSESLYQKNSVINEEDDNNFSFKTFIGYMILGYKNCAGVSFMLIMICLAQGANIAMVWWVKVLAQNSSYENLNVFAYLVGACYVLFFLRGAIINFPLINCSRVLHNHSVTGIVMASLQDIGNMGSEEIENRFSKDMNLVDQGLRNEFEDFCINAAGFLGSLGAACFIFPYQLIVTMMAVSYIALVINYFNKVLKELRKLDIESRPLIVSEIDKVLSGLASVRCYKLQLYFQSALKSKVSQNLSAYLTSKLMYLSLFNYLDIGANILSLASIISFILFRSSIDPGLPAIGISFSISMLTIVNNVYKCLIDFDNSLISVNRLLQYKDQLPEYTDGINQPITSSLIQFLNIDLKYSERHDYALQNLNLTFPSCSKTGIVGRSGAGKSSIFNVLLRIVRPVQGQVLIDGIDLMSFDLNYLRKIIVAIPQEPVVFNASLRMNLDPLGRVDDETLKKLVREFGLGDLLDAVNEDMDKNLGEVDLSLSAGQKQIFSLLRAAVNKGNVLVVDEATANIDQSLARFVDDKINEYFKDSTVIIIAHKLTSIVNCEQVAYMEDGKVVELGKIDDLMIDKNSKFQGLIHLMSEEERIEFFEYFHSNRKF